MEKVNAGTSREDLLEAARAQAKAARKGTAAAIQSLRLLAQLEGHLEPPPPKVGKTTIPKTSLKHLEMLLRSAQANRLAAEVKGSFVAASRYLTQERELLRDYEAARTASTKGADMTPDQRAEYLARMAAECSDEELEVFVGRYLDLHGLTWDDLQSERP